MIPYRRNDRALDPAQQAQLRHYLAAHGRAAAARTLGCSITTLEKLDGGGTALADTVDRLARRLDASPRS